MRTVQVINVRWLNATAWYGLYLARLLNEGGHPTRVVALPGTPPFRLAAEWGLSPLGISLNTPNPLRQPQLLAEVSRLIRSFAPDVVNCHRGEGFALFGLLRSLGLPRQFALVRTRGDQRLPRANLVNRFLYGHIADAVIATNSRMTDHLRQRMEVPEARLFRILGGVDGQRFRFQETGRERVRREFGFLAGTTVFGLLGRLDPVKGHWDFLRAAGALARQGVPVGVLIVGQEANLTVGEIEAAIEGEGLKGRAFVTGWRDDIADCLSALDVGVIASTGSEAIARAAFELLACGRPLVSSDVGVMPDIVMKDGLFAAGDADGLRKLMERAACDPAYRAGLLVAQNRVLETVRSDEFARRTLAAYEGALERVSHGRAPDPDGNVV